MLRSALLSCLFALAFVLMAGAAHAAPQILGLVATLDPVELQCDQGECSAEFSSICLQRHRASPTPGKQYFLHEQSDIAIIGRTVDGQVLSLPADDVVSIISLRGHSAVRIAIDVEELSRRGLKTASVRVGSDVSLIPKSVPGDPKPQTPEDIALATGPLRTLATAILLEDEDQLEAARKTARLINALPARGRATDAQRDSVWQRVSKPTDKRGNQTAEEAFRRCHSLTKAGTTSLRDCLGSTHDIFIGRLNNTYWDRSGAGS